MRLVSASESFSELGKESRPGSVDGRTEKQSSLQGRPPPTPGAQVAASGSWLTRITPSLDWVYEVLRDVGSTTSHVAVELLPPEWRPVPPEKAQSDAIDRYLEQESRKRDRELSCALFGNIDQKQILWKQIQLLHEPFSTEDQLDVIPRVQSSVFNMISYIFHKLVDEMETKAKEENLAEGDVWLEAVREVIRLEEDDKTKHEATKKIIRLNCGEFRAWLGKYNMSTEQLYRRAAFGDPTGLYACPYHDDKDALKLAARVLGEDYAPTDHDIVHFDKDRGKTLMRNLNIRTIHVDRGDYSLALHNPCGFAGERRKWIHFVQDVTSIWFVADLAMYDVYGSEGDSESFLEHEVMLFDSVAGSPRFRGAPVLLILSNVVAFRSRLKASPLKKVLTPFEDSGHDDEVDFVASCFLRSSGDRSDVHVFLLDVYDADSVRALLESASKTVLKPALCKLGLA